MDVTIPITLQYHIIPGTNSIVPDLHLVVVVGHNHQQDQILLAVEVVPHHTLPAGSLQHLIAHMRGEVVDIPVVVGVHTVVQADYTVVVSLVVGPERMVEGHPVV